MSYLDFQLLLYVPSEQYEPCRTFYEQVFATQPFYGWDEGPEDRGVSRLRAVALQQTAIGIIAPCINVAAALDQLRKQPHILKNIHRITLFLDQYTTKKWLPYRQPLIFLWQYRIILSADTASEVRQLLSQKRR